MAFLRYSYEIIPATKDPSEYERESDIIAGKMIGTTNPMKKGTLLVDYHYNFPAVLGQLIYIDEYQEDSSDTLSAGITIFDRTLLRWYDNHKDQLTDHKNRLAIKNKIGFMVEKLSGYGFNEEAMILLRWLHETGIDNEPSIMMLRIW